MAGIKQVSFTTPYSAEEVDIERNRRLADALRKQAATPLETNRMVGRVAIPISPWEGAAKLAQGLSAGYQEEQATKRQKALGERQRGDFNADRAALVRALQGVPATSEQIVDEQANDGMGAQATINAPAVAPNPQGIQGMDFRSPMFQGIQAQQLAAQMQPKEAYTLGPGAVRLGPDNKPIASAPFKPDAPQKPSEFESMIRASGIDPASPEGQRLAKSRLEKMTTHAPAPSVKVDVKTGESLGKEIGPIVAESRAGALGALQTAEVANRVGAAISKGNVLVGPGATIRNSVDQIAQTVGITGKDTEERLVNTRNVIRGLAQATIAARKQLKGQGQVSDFEGKLLTKGESGEIDSMTLPELKSFMAVSERLAKLQYDLHSRNVDVMRKRKDLENLVPFYEVPPWGAFNAPAESGAPGEPPPGAVRTRK